MQRFTKGASQSRLTLSVGFVTLMLVLGIISYDRQVGTVTAGTEHNMSGWAWSDTVGWLSFNSLNGSPGIDYGVNATVDGNGNLNGPLSGYAWNDNVGWISFNCVLGGECFAPTESSFPSGAALSAGARAAGNTIQGFVRACSVFATGCQGSLKAPDRRGGWDGWISLAGESGNGRPYGVTFDPATKKFGVYHDYTRSQNHIAASKSFAWGDANIGWVNFQPRECAPGEDPSLCGVILGRPQLGISCSVDVPLNNTSPVTATWTAHPRGGSGNYQYKWELTKTSATCSPDSDADFSSVRISKRTVCSSNPNSTGIVNATVTVNDGTDVLTSSSCVNGQGIFINQPQPGYSLRASPGSVSALFLGGVKATTTPVALVGVNPFGPPNPAFHGDVTLTTDPIDYDNLGIPPGSVTVRLSKNTTGDTKTWTYAYPITLDKSTPDASVNSQYADISLQVYLSARPRVSSFPLVIKSQDGMSTTVTVNIDRGTSNIQER